MPRWPFTFKRKPTTLRGKIVLRPLGLYAREFVCAPFCDFNPGLLWNSSLPPSWDAADLYELAELRSLIYMQAMRSAYHEQADEEMRALR